MIATPITNPPKMSQMAAEENPAKITFAGETENNIASRKKRRDVICSGIMPVAHKTMVTKARAATFDSDGGNSPGGSNNRAAAPNIDNTVKNSFRYMVRKPEFNEKAEVPCFYSNKQKCVAVLVTAICIYIKF